VDYRQPSATPAGLNTAVPLCNTPSHGGLPVQNATGGLMR